MSEPDAHFMQMALDIAKQSRDRSTKVGCVIVSPDGQLRATGYNGFPQGTNEQIETRHQRPDKYLWTEHAERNAIYSAAKEGISLRHCRLYLPWFPCMDCARAIVQTGIDTLVAYRPDLNHPQWGDQFKSSMELLQEVGVRLVWFEQPEMHVVQTIRE